MKKLIWCLYPLGLLCACEPTIALSTINQTTMHQNQTISYQLVQHYFIKNNITTLLPVRITTAAQFTHYFGQATTANTQPTPIDFNRDDLIVIDHPITSTNTRLNILSLTRVQSKIVLNYTIETNQSLGYQMHPCLLIAIPKTQQGQIILKPHTIQSA